MSRILFYAQIIFFGLLASGCTAKYVVRSNPLGADVYYRPPASERKIKLGSTPLELTEDTIVQVTGLSRNSTDYFELVFEKQGFRSERLMVPGARFGSMETTISVGMVESANEGAVARDLLQFVMNAQKFANAGDFQRAHIEVDRALALDQRFARAASMKGAVYFMEKNYRESLNWYEKALSLDSQQQDVVKMVAHLRRLMTKDREKKQ